MSNKQKLKRGIYPFIVYCLLLIGLLPLLWNLLRPGFYISDDGEWMAIRLTAFHQSVREGQLPVRWTRRLNHEYGYPVMNFLYPLPFYLAEPLYAGTKQPTLAIKIVMGISIISMAFGMYALMRKKDKMSAFVAALVYVYAPYVSFNTYQRGSFGEIVAMGIAPWVFWAIQKKQFPLASLFVATMILSHNVVAALFFPLILLYCGFKIYYNRSGRNDYNINILPIFSIVLGLGLSSFFWFPALTELQYVRASQIPVSDFQDEYLPAGDAFQRTGVIQSVLTLGFPLYLLSQRSAWFWNSIPGLKIIQFPWRILSLSAFLSSIVVGTLIWKMKHNRGIQYAVAFIVVAVAIASSWKFLVPKSFVERPKSYYETNDDTTTVRAEYTPIWVTKLPMNRPEIPTQHYYPGWKAFWRSTPLASFVTADGDFTLVPEVRYVWGETTSRTIANLTSAISLLIIAAWYQKSDQRYA